MIDHHLPPPLPMSTNESGCVIYMDGSWCTVQGRGAYYTLSFVYSNASLVYAQGLQRAYTLISRPLPSYKVASSTYFRVSAVWHLVSSEFSSSLVMLTAAQHLHTSRPCVTHRVPSHRGVSLHPQARNSSFMRDM